MWAAIFVRKEERDLLSLISLGIDFQRNDPQYIKRFYTTRLRGLKYNQRVDKRRVRIGGHEIFNNYRQSSI